MQLEAPVAQAPASHVQRPARPAESGPTIERANHRALRGCIRSRRESSPAQGLLRHALVRSELKSSDPSLVSVFRAALSASLLLGSPFLGSGCSYALVHGPTQTDRLTHPGGQESSSWRASCTSSDAAPIVDTILGVSLVGLGGGVAVAAASSHSFSSTTGSHAGPGRTAALLCTGCQATPVDDSSWEAAGIAFVAGTVALGTLFLASAVTGYGRTADCRAVVETLPAGPHPSARYLRDLNALAEMRARERQERF